MKKLIRVLFSVADTLAYLQILATVILLVRLLGEVLTISFATDAAPASSTLISSSWAWFVVALVSGSLGIFGCYLHLKRQVLGVVLIALVLLLSLLAPYARATLFVILVPVQVTIYALPWLLMRLDLKRQNATQPPG